MANNYGNRKHIDVSWGQGDTTMFVRTSAVTGAFELLDYEYDYDCIHGLCGGRCYYVSRSGYSGAGYINRLGSLTKVGYYRVDTKEAWHRPEEVAPGIKVLLPYVSHQADKKETLENYPVVLLVGESTVLYTGWYTSFQDTLLRLLLGEEVETTPLSQKFVRNDTFWFEKKQKEVSINFGNFFGRRYKVNPWEFKAELLEDFLVDYPTERPWSIFHVATTQGGLMVKTTKISGKLYATELLEKDPCEEATTAPKGWECEGRNLVYRVREDEVYVIGWELAQPLYEKRIERAARFFPSEKAEEFKKMAAEQSRHGKYVEYELSVQKLLFFLTKEEQIEEIRKGILKKSPG